MGQCYTGDEVCHSGGLRINVDHLGIFNVRRNLEHTGVFHFASINKAATTAGTKCRAPLNDRSKANTAKTAGEPHHTETA